MSHNKYETVIAIGNEVCDECGEYRDCGLEYDDCLRLQNAIVIFEKGIIDIRGQHKKKAPAKSKG